MEARVTLQSNAILPSKFEYIKLLKTFCEKFNQIRKGLVFPPTVLKLLWHSMPPLEALVKYYDLIEFDFFKAFKENVYRGKLYSRPKYVSVSVSFMTRLKT